MAFLKKNGSTKVVYLPVTASTAIAAGALVTFSSGLLIAATSSTAACDIIGVNVKAIVSTDADYAISARLIPVEVARERFVIWEADTASAVAGDIGTQADLTDSVTVNRGASTVNVFTVTRVVSATKVQGVLNIGPDHGAAA